MMLDDIEGADVILMSVDIVARGLELSHSGDAAPLKMSHDHPSNSTRHSGSAASSVTFNVSIFRRSSCTDYSEEPKFLHPYDE